MDERFFNFINEHIESKVDKLITKLENEEDRELEEIIIHLTSLFI